jgi:hypothetical protein
MGVSGCVPGQFATETGRSASPLLPRLATAPEADTLALHRAFTFQILDMVGATGIEPVTPTMST